MANRQYRLTDDEIKIINIIRETDESIIKDLSKKIRDSTKEILANVKTVKELDDVTDEIVDNIKYLQTAYQLSETLLEIKVNRNTIDKEEEPQKI